MRRLVLLYLFSLVIFCAAQPCVFTQNQFYSYDEVNDCFHSILLTDEVKYTTLQTLRRSIELYPFLDIANNSPDPNLPLKVDMLRGLDVINQTNYYYDVDFHAALRDLYIQLRDAHTQYYHPTCYQNIQIRQGFAPVGWGSTPEEFQIAVSGFFPDDLLEYYSSINIDLTKYINYTISQIDGVNTYDYLMQYANSSLGISKDVGARFNFVLTVPEPNPGTLIVAYGYWQQRTKRNPFPEADSVNYLLVNPTDSTTEKVTLPWTFKALKTYTGVDSFMEDYYSPFYSPSNSHKVVDPVEFFSQYDESEEMSAASVEHSFMNIKNPSTLEKIKEHKESIVRNHLGLDGDQYTFTMLANSSHLSFWELSDGKTLVMYLDTMAPGRFSGYYPTLIQGFQAAADRGLTRFIIDLTNNGGGNICLGQSLLSFLQRDGWPGQGQNWGPQDLPLSDLAEQLTNAAVQHNITSTVWSPGFYANQHDEPIDNSDTSYIIPGVPHERGGKVRNYSKLLHINDCGEFGYEITPAVNFSPSETLIITKGFCGSTCALFANHMSLYDGVKTIVVGGMPGRDPMQYSSFPGLQVLDNRPLFAQLARLRQNITWTPYESNPNDIVPRVLPTQADFRYCIREIYPNTKAYSTNPMEFTFQQADYHIYNTELFASYPQYVWYEALNFFS